MTREEKLWFAALVLIVGVALAGFYLFAAPVR